MQKHKKYFQLGLILLMTLLLSGCRSFLIPQDEPLVLNNSLMFQKSPQSKMEILSFKSIGTGVVQDISYDGSMLLLLNTTEAPPITYNINLLKITEHANQLTSFVNSDKHQISARFGEYASGVFYIERGNTQSDEKPTNQLLWTSVDKSTTKTISSPDENITSNISIVDDEHVLYTNASNQIILTNTTGDRKVYTTSRNFTISNIVYYKPKQTLFFIATDPLNPQKSNLYQTEIKEDTNALNSSLVDENIINFSLNRQSGDLIYTQSYGDTRRIMTCSASQSTQPTMLSEGNYTSAVYTPNGDKILYSQFSSMNTKSSQSIFIMDANGKNKLQISAPLTITSPIVAHPYKSTVYFSVEKRFDESGNGSAEDISKQPVSQVYKIDYNIQ